MFEGAITRKVLPEKIIVKSRVLLEDNPKSSAV